MTISYEIPSVLLPFGAAVAPVVEGVISADLARFRDYAERKRL